MSTDSESTRRGSTEPNVGPDSKAASQDDASSHAISSGPAISFELVNAARAIGIDSRSLSIAPAVLKLTRWQPPLRAIMEQAGWSNPGAEAMRIIAKKLAANKSMSTPGVWPVLPTEVVNAVLAQYDFRSYMATQVAELIKTPVLGVLRPFTTQLSQEVAKTMRLQSWAGQLASVCANIDSHVTANLTSRTWVLSDDVIERLSPLIDSPAIESQGRLADGGSPCAVDTVVPNVRGDSTAATPLDNSRHDTKIATYGAVIATVSLVFAAIQVVATINPDLGMQLLIEILRLLNALIAS